jgi:hypothetical protein
LKSWTQTAKAGTWTTTARQYTKDAWRKRMNPKSKELEKIWATALSGERTLFTEPEYGGHLELGNTKERIINLGDIGILSNKQADKLVDDTIKGKFVIMNEKDIQQINDEKFYETIMKALEKFKDWTNPKKIKIPKCRKKIFEVECETDIKSFEELLGLSPMPKAKPRKPVPCFKWTGERWVKVRLT